MYIPNKVDGAPWAGGKESISGPSHAKCHSEMCCTESSLLLALSLGNRRMNCIVKRTFLAVTQTGHKTTDRLLGSRTE